MAEKPKPTSLAAERELDKVESQFNEIEKDIKKINIDRMGLVPKLQYESQTKMPQSEIANSKIFVLKPSNFVTSREKFNERFRDSYNYDKEYIEFIAENIEIRGEMIEMWTKPYPGMPAEFWKIPVNKPLAGPRYVCEQLKRKFHHKLTMQEGTTVGSDGMGQYYGKMAVETTVQRLDAREIPKTRSYSMSI